MELRLFWDKLWFIEIPQGCSTFFRAHRRRVMKLHGKQLTERRLFFMFFQPWRVHFACVFSRICVWVLFFDSVKSCDIFFLNFFVSDFQVFVSHAFQDLSSISIDIIWSSGRCPRSVQPLFDQCVDLGVKLGSHISLHLAKETGSIGDGYIVFPRPGTNAGEWCAMEGMKKWRA